MMIFNEVFLLIVLIFQTTGNLQLIHPTLVLKVNLRLPVFCTYM